MPPPALRLALLALLAGSLAEPPPPSPPLQRAPARLRDVAPPLLQQTHPPRAPAVELPVPSRAADRRDAPASTAARPADGGSSWRSAEAEPLPGGGEPGDDDAGGAEEAGGHRRPMVHLPFMGNATGCEHLLLVAPDPAGALYVMRVRRVSPASWLHACLALGAALSGRLTPLENLLTGAAAMAVAHQLARGRGGGPAGQLHRVPRAAARAVRRAHARVCLR